MKPKKNYAHSPAPKQDRREMMLGGFTTDYPRGPAMVEFVAGATLASEDKSLPDDASEFARAGYHGCHAAGAFKS